MRRFSSYFQHTARRAAAGASGFTAIELMVTIAILGVLIALAAPSFASILESWRVRQAVEDLQSTLYFARSEAIRRGGKVVIQKISNGTTGCNTATAKTDWDCGWFVCEDTNDNGKCAASEPVLRSVSAPRNTQVTRTGGADTIKLNRWGLVDGTWLGFSLVPYGKSTTHTGARGLCMSSAGRIRIISPEEIPCTSG